MANEPGNLHAIVVNLEDRRPHVTIPTRTGVHVVPVDLVKRWASGEVEPPPECVQQIIDEWLALIRAEKFD